MALTSSSCLGSRLTCVSPLQRLAPRKKDAGGAVVDVSGSPSPLTDEIAFRRMERGGIELTITSAIISELAVNWSNDDGQKLIQKWSTIAV